MSSVTASADIDRVKPEELPRWTSIVLQNIIDTVNGSLDFQTNFNGNFVTITFTASNTDTAAIHGLGRVPTGYLVIGLSAAITVYDGSVASSTQLLYLRASGTGIARLFVF